MFEREIVLLDNFSARQAAVLIRLASGKSISQTARELEMSRTTVHRLLKDSNFRLAILEEQRHLVAIGTIEDRCLAFRRKVLKAIIRTFSKEEKCIRPLLKFKNYLDKIDRQTGMGRHP